MYDCSGGDLIGTDAYEERSCLMAADLVISDSTLTTNLRGNFFQGQFPQLQDVFALEKFLK